MKMNEELKKYFIDYTNYLEYPEEFNVEVTESIRAFLGRYYVAMLKFLSYGDNCYEDEKNLFEYIN